jgi:hypothetical protein
MSDEVEGPVRKFLREWKPLIPRKKLLGEIIVAGTPVDAEMERMLEEKKREWRSKHYPEKLISMAEDLARGWVAKLSETFAPPEVREAVIRHMFPKALDVASKWIETMGEAAKASMQKL